MKSPASSRKAKSPDPQEVVAEFVEQLGLVGEADGLPRIAGRILGLLVIHGGPLSFAKLSDELQISRGSVSTNTRLLESLGILVRTTRTGERQDYFKLAPNPYYRLMSRVAERSVRATSVVEKAREDLPAEWSEAKKRLRDLAAFYRTVREMSQRLAEDLKDQN